MVEKEDVFDEREKLIKEPVESKGHDKKTAWIYTGINKTGNARALLPTSLSAQGQKAATICP